MLPRNRPNRHIGFHTSIAGGIHRGLERAHSLGCNTVQIFSHNPRGWGVKEIPSEQISKFRKLRTELKISPVFIHTSYLINPAASKNSLRKKSISLLIKELDIADLIGADYVILHPGSASLMDEKWGRKMTIESLKEVAKNGMWGAKLLLENTAGERGDISSGIASISEIIDGVDSSLIGGICIDTCHAFQAGYNLSNKNGIDEMVKEIEKYMGIERVKLIHLNDSKRKFNSRVDRHEHIGKGFIGREGFRIFLNYPSLKHIPIILETPKETEGDDISNLKAVKKLI